MQALKGKEYKDFRHLLPFPIIIAKAVYNYCYRGPAKKGNKDEFNLEDAGGMQYKGYVWYYNQITLFIGLR